MLKKIITRTDETINLGANVSKDAVELGFAVIEWRKKNKCHPSDAEILTIVKSLGYAKEVLSLHELKVGYIKLLLQKFKGNKRAVARALRVNVRTVYTVLEKDLCIKR